LTFNKIDDIISGKESDMKITGKGSVASVLRRILDVVWILLFVAIGGVLIATIVWAVMPLKTEPEAAHGGLTISADFLRLTFNDLEAGNQRVLTAGILGLAVIGLVIAQLVVSRLRKIFKTLQEGVVFSLENALHIRAIGIICIAGAAVQTLASLVVGFLVAGAIAIPGIEVGLQPGNSLTGIFLGLVILVLSEAFRLAAGLQEDHDLTV
jgi:hypothetical protein